MRVVMRTLRGVVTVGRRRGLGYGSHLLFAVVWPKTAYRLFWGPRAPAVLRRLFHATRWIVSRRAATTELNEIGLRCGDSLESGHPDPSGVAVSLDRAHSRGIAGVLSSQGGPVQAVVGGDRGSFATAPARLYYRRGVHFQAARDADRRAANDRFGTALLTERDAREQLRAMKAKVRQAYRDYAPIDFGGGLTFGRIASTDSGTGRWDFLNRHVVAPLVAGKRVLDLGCNNGSLTLMMLRAGAREVTAIEADPAIAEFARLNARILAWRDIRTYRVQVLTADMRLILDDTLGCFDVVTAFCSLYYLPEADMSRVITRAAAMGATLVLQANDAIGNLPAHTHRLRELMQVNGFPQVAVHAPRGFARPLLVGTPSLREQPCAYEPARGRFR